MSLFPITDAAQLDAALASAGDSPVVVGFFGAFSALATQARPAFEAFAEDADAPVLLVDVGEVKGLHARFGVSAVPAAVTVQGGQVIRRAAGRQDAEAWARALLPHESAVVAPAGGAVRPPVTVYVSPTCVWCGRVKDYLRQHGVRFREVDVSVDPAAAQALVARSGQVGVPQVEIGHEIVVGFDKPRLERLLGLQAA
ncbi:glutaredoxin [Myxococcota bacterium]|nr:glutaredoxin [Myxococcota bacterium]